MQAVVVGQVARDIVLCVDHVPGRREAVPATRKIETLGGKGANIAVGLTQLGTPTTLLGVVGDDDEVLTRAQEDGIDITHVVHRRGVATGVVVDMVDSTGHWHYVEYLPPEVLLTKHDVTAASDAITAADAVVVQLQQPADAALAAVDAARGLVILDGTPTDELLDGADVLRADAREANTSNPDDAIDAAQNLVARHDLTLVAFGVDGGDVAVWRGGARLFEHGDEPVVDTTGGGDAFTAALTHVLLNGGTPEEAAELAVAAAGATVQHPGGRPDLRRERLQAG